MVIEITERAFHDAVFTRSRGVRNVVELSSNSPSPELWSALLGLRRPTTYPPGKPLFSCDQLTRGIYLVEKGRVKLFLCSETTGASFDEAGPGSVLGLSEAISGGKHKLTAVAVDCAQVAFVSRDDLLAFLQQNQGYCMELVQFLSEDLHLLYHRFRSSPAATQTPGLKPVSHKLSYRQRPN